MIISIFPIFFVDILGSILMIILSFLCLNVVLELKGSDLITTIEQSLLPEYQMKDGMGRGFKWESHNLYL